MGVCQFVARMAEVDEFCCGRDWFCCCSATGALVPEAVLFILPSVLPLSLGVEVALAPCITVPLLGFQGERSPKLLLIPDGVGGEKGYFIKEE